MGGATGTPRFWLRMYAAMLAMAPPLLWPVTYTGSAALGWYPATRVWTGSMTDVVASKKPLWTRPGTRFGPLVHVVGSAKKSCSQSSRPSGSLSAGGSVPRGDHDAKRALSDGGGIDQL